MTKSVRKPSVSGQFYDSNKSILASHIKKLLGNAKNPSKKEISGIIVPHAGYSYSGKAAASAYSRIKGKKIDTFVILGVNHSGFENAVSFQDFETPLGVAENDIEFSKEISKIIKNNESFHLPEHSIEVQIPFLQIIFKKPRIVPILLGSIRYEECKRIASEIKKIAEKQKKKVCVIASSDFTHYGKAYGYLPFSGNNEQIKKKMHELDMKAVSFIEKMDSKGFFDFSSDKTICGRIPITVAIEACRLKKAKARLVEYCTSGDVSKDSENSVGYASIIFET
jgi:hypothetical protein